MRLVQNGAGGVEIKLSVKNVEQLASVIESGEFGLRLSKYFATEGGVFGVVIGVERDEDHYGDDGVAR